jgi:4-hydroxy-tetrahydrodipicolinate reductase
VLELHHSRKIDAPSGTALRLGEAAAAAHGRRLPDLAVYHREGETGARDPAAIGMQALRAGDSVGEHTVFLAGPGERLELTHRALSRDNFAAGAVRAAAWVHGRPPGLYTMREVLAGPGLRSPAARCASADSRVGLLGRDPPRVRGVASY